MFKTMKTMKSISVPFLSSDHDKNILVYDELWVTVPKYPIDEVNWSNFPYKPDVRFSLAYSQTGIYLKFWVTEDGVRGLVMEDNGRVYTDSCVELFIDPSGDGTYYNFEFNCIGTLLLAHGATRDNRKKAPETVLSKILRSASLGKEKTMQEKGLCEWNLTSFIPYEAFFEHHIQSLSGKTVRANFQKCGDEMAVPHFITWNPIVTPQPDYHRPEFFGELRFE